MFFEVGSPLMKLNHNVKLHIDRCQQIDQID